MQPMETTTVVVHQYGPEWWLVLLLMVPVVVVALAVYEVACSAWDRVLVWWDARPGADEVDAPADAPWPVPIPEPDTSGGPVRSQVEPFVPSDPHAAARSRRQEGLWWACGEVLHRWWCTRLDGAPLAEALPFVVTVTDARLRADDDGLSACGDCDPVAAGMEPEVRS